MTWALNHLSFTQQARLGGGKSFCWLIKMPTLPSPPTTQGRGGGGNRHRELWTPKSDSEWKTATKTQEQRDNEKKEKQKDAAKWRAGSKRPYLGHSLAIGVVVGIFNTTEWVSSLWAWFLFAWSAFKIWRWKQMKNNWCTFSFAWVSVLKSKNVSRVGPSNLFRGAHARVEANPHVVLFSLQGSVLVDSPAPYALPRANRWHPNASH